MKKTVILLAVIMLASFLAPNISEAKLMENGKNDRKGFFLGFGVGGGGTNINGSGVSRTRGAFISDLKIGGGITEDILLMYDGFFAYTKIEGVNFELFTFPVALQWYAYKDFYIRPGVGISYAEASTTVSGVNISTTSKVSVAAQLATGYDFRFGKYFALSPELVYFYDHIRSSLSNANAHTFGAQASFMWFF